jgi:hypothetical protein
MVLVFAGWIFPMPAHSNAPADTAELSSQIINRLIINETENKAPKPGSIQANTKSVSASQGKNRSVNVKQSSGSASSISGYSGRHYTADEVKALIVSYSKSYGINPDIPLCIAKYESGYNHLSKNKSSSAAGTFQYLEGTWKATDEGKAGYSVYDAEANIKAAVKYMASRKSTKPWTVNTKCPKLT